MRPVLAVVLLSVAVFSSAVQCVLVSRGVLLFDDGSWHSYAAAVAPVVPAAVGSLLLVRQAGAPLGWVLSAAGTLASVDGASTTYLQAAPAGALGSLSFEVVSWLNHWTGATSVACLPVLLVLFPDGRAPGPSWRWPVRLSLGALAVVVLAMLLAEGYPGGWSNPVAPVPLGGWAQMVSEAGLLVVTATTALGLLALAVRFRRARGVERQQVTCLLYGVGVTLVSLYGDGPWGWRFAVLSPAPAIAIGVAVLRYRLYDIDRLVSRTVSYAVLTACIGVPYVGLVMGFSAVVGGSGELGVVVATLAAAAAFDPLRRRVQMLVDRRFDRSRYDAERTVEAFADRLRQQVDLEAVRAELLETVCSTMQPASADLWLRAPHGRAT